ncbi:phenol hydroxylase P0 protein [Burkholderiaceae bacterium]|nr:phenol hydroxylase P0 protein [Burkholderiaceae bacterium]
MRIDSSPPQAALTSASELPACDTSRRFVRVIEQRTDGLVAFEFAIGWPDLAVELLLPQRAFADFCAAHRVQRLDEDSAAGSFAGQSTAVRQPMPHRF